MLTIKEYGGYLHMYLHIWNTFKSLLKSIATYLASSNVDRIDL